MDLQERAYQIKTANVSKSDVEMQDGVLKITIQKTLARKSAKENEIAIR